MHISTGRRWVITALVIADVAFAFQQTAVIPAIPTIESDLHTTATWSAWLLSGYLVLSSVATPLLGKMADRYGKRRLMTLALGLFFLGSVGAALSPNIATLIIFRAVQGFGGAVFPLTQSIARDEVPDERVGSLIGLLTAAFGAGTAVGFGVGGLLGQLNWRLIFWVGAAAVAVATVIGWLLVPRSPERNKVSLDLPGGLYFGGGLASLLLALTVGSSAGWSSPLFLLFAVLSAALLVAWYVRDRRTEEPLIDLGVLSTPQVLLPNLATLALGYVMFGTYFLLPHLVEAPRHAPPAVADSLHYGFGASATVAGLFLLPAALGQLVAGPLSGVLERRIAPRWPVTIGMLAAAGGAALLAFAHGSAWTVVIGVFLIGSGAGFVIESSGTLITRGVSADQTGVATALNSTLRRVGGGVGSQVGSVLLIAFALAGSAETASEQGFVVGFAVMVALGLLGAGCGALVPSAR